MSGKEKINELTRIQENYKKLIDTLRKEKEILKENEKKYKNILNTVKEGIIYIDKKGRVLDINRRLTAITGVPREDIVGKLNIDIVKKFLKPKDIPRIIKLTYEIMRGKSKNPFKIEYTEK